MKRRKSGLADEVHRAQAEIAKWPKEKRESVQLEGTDIYQTAKCKVCGEFYRVLHGCCVEPAA